MSGVMAQPAAEAPAASFAVRTISALILAPAAIALAIGGGVAFAGLVALVAALAALEWHRLTEPKVDRRAGYGLATVLALAALLAGLDGLASGWALVGAALAGVLVLARQRGLWWALGLVYIATPCLALLWLRERPEIGLASVLWLFAVVWTADTCALVVGRAVGGPRLAPRISPKKTWTGLVGGVLGAAAVGALSARVLAGGDPVVLAVLAAGLAVIAQAGDLWESWIKRRAGVKDSGRLIPGHGGVLDRIDGLMTAAPALALIARLAPEELPTWP